MNARVDADRWIDRQTDKWLDSWTPVSHHADADMIKRVLCSIQLRCHYNKQALENEKNNIYEPHREKTFLCHMRTTMAQISLSICTV